MHHFLWATLDHALSEYNPCGLAVIIGQMHELRAPMAAMLEMMVSCHAWLFFSHDSLLSKPSHEEALIVYLEDKDVLFNIMILSKH
jgi:hypothetical protein